MFDGAVGSASVRHPPCLQPLSVLVHSHCTVAPNTQVDATRCHHESVAMVSRRPCCQQMQTLRQTFSESFQRSTERMNDAVEHLRRMLLILHENQI